MSKQSALAHAQTTLVAPAPAQVSVAAPTPAAEPAQQTPAATEATVPSSLAKKEAEIVRKQQEFKKLQAEFEPKQKKADEIIKLADEFNALRTTDPIAALRRLGFTETEIFNFLSQSEKPAELTLEQKAAAAAESVAKATIDEWNKEQQENRAKEAEARDQKTLTAFKSQISGVISSNPDKFEYCAFEGPAAEALIYETVLQSVAASEGKEAISAEEAAELVENYYEERDKGMSALKKRQPVPAPVESPKKPERTRTVDPNSPGVSAAKANVQRTRTLTNSATATVASTTVKRPETASEKRTRLEAWLKTGQNPGKG